MGRPRYALWACLPSLAVARRISHSLRTNAVFAGGFLVKGITDTLTTVQDNALDALVAYLKKAPEAAAAR